MSPTVKEFDGISFDVEKSIRYHNRRREHYERQHKRLMFGVIMFGSAAFAELLQKSSWFGLGAATLGAIDLVYGLGHKTRDHELLYRRFNDLSIQMKIVASPTEEDVRLFKRKILEIEADEPPVFWALEASCDNEVTIAWGREKNAGLVTLGFWKTLLMNWVTFSKAELPRSPFLAKSGQAKS